MKRLIHIALNQPLMVLMATLLFILAGVVAFKNLSVEAFPDVTDTQVTVIALYPGRAAEEVEKQVSLPIEVALSGLPNSIRVFSHTQFGLSFTVVTYDDKADVNIARQQVNERLRGIDLPPGVEADVMPNATPVGEVMRYRLKGDGKTTTELRTLQDWVVERALRQVPGVADVVGMGGYIKQYEVQPDLQKLRAYKLTLQDLQDALGRSNANAGGSYVAQGAQQFAIRGIGLLHSADDLGTVVITARGNTPVLVRDVPNEAAAAMALIENIQREDLNPLEEAQGLQRLIREFGLTHEQAAQAVGRSRSAASNLLRLLQLAEPVQNMLMAGDIDMGHARALLALDRATQITAANQISAKKLSVREAESLVKKLSAEFNLVPEKPKKEKPRDMKRVEEELSDLLTAQVEVRVKKRVKRNGKMEDMGEVAIAFGSLDELNGLIDRLRGHTSA